jgi:peroxiredoxin Q/BCP
MREIAAGSPAPTFDMPTAGGGHVSLASLAGRKIVLFFYPKADTPGCTTESVDFSRLAEAFERSGAVVIGVSRDPVARLERFKAKHELQVILASDEAGEVTQAYGVWGEKTLYGRTYMGIERATFLIDGEGVVQKVWRKVKVKGHAQEALTAVEEA